MTICDKCGKKIDRYFDPRIEIDCGWEYHICAKCKREFVRYVRKAAKEMKVCDICKRDLEKERGFHAAIRKGNFTYEQYDFCEDCLCKIVKDMGFEKEREKE